MVEIDNLSFRYGRREVLSQLSLTLEPGKIYGLFGENGTGKTTFLSLLCGLKKPSGGSIRVPVGGTPWQRSPEFLEWVYFLPDDFSVYSGTPVRFEKDFAPFRKGFDKEGYYRLLERFGIDIHQRMDRMSYGQLKKVHIAFALCSGAGLLLMDEPTNGLDVPSKAAFCETVKRFSLGQGTVVIATHQVQDVADLIDQTLSLAHE